MNLAAWLGPAVDFICKIDEPLGRNEVSSLSPRDGKKFVGYSQVIRVILEGAGQPQLAILFLNAAVVAVVKPAASVQFVKKTGFRREA